MAIEGPLKELGIQDVLQLLELAGKSGVLSVRSERLNDEAVVHFEKGDIVFAMRKRSTRRLGQQLLRAGKLTERELERALEIQKHDPNQRLAEILLEMGSAEQAELEQHLRFQVEETIYDLIGWDEGRFRFDEQVELPRERIGIRIRVESLLMEGARRIDEWSRLEPKVPSLDAVPVLAPAGEGDAPPLQLRPEEWEVLAEVDGERGLRRIAADLGRSTFDVAKTIYGLISMGVVNVQEHASRLPELELEAAIRGVEALMRVGDVKAAAHRATELQAGYPERAELALLAGRAFAAQGRMRAAAEAFGRAVGLDPLSPDAHFHLGFAAVRVGEFGRAARALDAYLRLATNGERRQVVTDALAAVRALDEILNPEATEANERAGAV